MIDFAPIFAGYEARREQLRAWVAKHYIGSFGLVPGRLLDIGCGNGFWGSLFAEAGFEVTGFDVDPALIEDGQARYPAVALRVGNAESLYRWRNVPTVFVRTIPQFYAPELDGLELVVRRALEYVAEDGLILLSAYSDGSGSDHENLVGGVARHHRDADFLAAVTAAGGAIAKTERLGNYLQVGVRR